MELHDQCACNLARARSAARSSPEGGTRAGGKDGSWLAAQSPPARPASPLRELPPQFATPRQRSAARPAPTLAFKCQSSAISGLFQRRGRLPPVPPRAQERTTRTHRGIRSRARPASLRRVSPARDHLSYAPSLTATRQHYAVAASPFLGASVRHAVARWLCKRACPAPVSQGAGPLGNSGCRHFRRQPRRSPTTAPQPYARV